MKYLLSLSLAAFSLVAQSDPNLLSSGYSAPAPIDVAPGQVTSLFVRGIQSGRSGQAAVAPLPDTLAGLAAYVIQDGNRFKVPLAAVKQQTDCPENSTRPICELTVMRVQIPTELNPAPAQLALEVDGQLSRTFPLNVLRDNSHVLTNCDITWDINPASECRRRIYHNDGLVVEPSNPARLGETLVIYAYGFGATSPNVPSGQPAPAGVTLPPTGLRALKVTITDLINAAPALPRFLDADNSGAPNMLEFIGLSAGHVGLYQLNVRVPNSLNVPLPCGGEIRTNALVKVATSLGTENIPLCVAP